MTAKEMREKRANLVQQARAILDKAETEKRNLSAEESTQWDNLHAEADRLKKDIDRAERQEQADLELRNSQGTLAGNRGSNADPDAPGGNEEERKAKESEAFRSWLQFGMEGLTPEQRTIMGQRRQVLSPEMRAQAVGTGTAGGYLVPEGFTPRIETALKAFAGVRNTRATVIRTDSGADIPWPTSDDTDNTGEMLGENKAASEQDMEFGSKTIRAYMFSSKIVRVSLQFLQDVGISGIEEYIAARLGERIGRATATKNITGTGNNQPEGLASAATLGVTGASTTSITYDEFVDLEHSIDPAYRRQAEFLMADGLLKAAKKLKDGEGRPLWVPGMASREPDRILNYPYTVDQEIPTPTNSAITAYFGDFSKFLLRDVRQMQMLRLTERYAEYLQVAFLLFMRHDSALIDAGTHPIKYFQQLA